MPTPPLDPLTDPPIPPWLAALPKADLHLHQEERPRLERIVARRAGRPAHDWRGTMRRIAATTPPGMPRLAAMANADAALGLDDVAGDAPEDVVAKLADILEEGAADGAWLIEVRCGPGGGGLLRPDFMALFREAERRVQRAYPHLRAEAIGFLLIDGDPARRDLWARYLDACLRAAREGLAGVDFRVDPYDTEADPARWAVAAEWAARATAAGLGVTIHAGEFSPANLLAALRVPGVTRLGHAVFADADPRLLDTIARSGVTLECCPTCNVLLGAVDSYEAHPFRRLAAAGIPITLNTDNPVRLATTIGREYAIAAALGLPPAALLSYTRHAISASFAPPARRAALLANLDTWAAAHSPAADPQPATV